MIAVIASIGAAIPSPGSATARGTPPAGGIAPEATPPTSGAARDPIVVRLEALEPSRPLEYLELAELVQSTARNDEERRLARTLYGLAGALDPAGLGSSAALALASMAETPGDRSRLVRIAAALSAPARRVDASRDPSLATVRFAQLLAAYRRGDGSRARDLLRAAEVGALVDQYGAIFEGGAAGFRNAVAALRDRPLDSEARRFESMFLEQALLSGGRSLGSDLIRSNGEPLAACDPLDPGPEFGVDRRHAWWRNGRWEALDSAESPSQTPPTRPTQSAP